MAKDVDKMSLFFKQVLESFKLQNLKDSQQEALQNLVKGQDVFIIQPTGSGKSLIFQSALIVFDTVRPLSNAKLIALVIPPLAFLMQDQVQYLKSVGIKAEFIEDEQESEEAKQTVECGECQIFVWLTQGIFICQRMMGNAQLPCLKKEIVWLQLMKFTAFLAAKSIHIIAFPSVL